MFLFIGGYMLISNFFNVNFNTYNNDYSNSFRVIPDYITGNSFVGYRKTRKQLNYE